MSTTCYSVAFLNATAVAVDCRAANNDFYYVLVRGAKDAVRYDAPAAVPYSNVQRRFTRVHTVQGLTSATTYLYRAVPSFGTTDSTRWGESAVEVFALDASGAPKRVSVLDRATLAVLLPDVPADFSFDLVDLRVTSDALVYVLDEYTRLYRLAL